MTAGIVLLIFLALLLGAAAGWLVWGRAGAGLARERDDLREKFSRAIAELAGAEERARRSDRLQAELDGARGEREAARIGARALRSEGEAKATAFEERLTELRDAKEALSRQFGEVGAKLLEEAQARFLERA